MIVADGQAELGWGALPGRSKGAFGTRNPWRGPAVGRGADRFPEKAPTSLNILLVEDNPGDARLVREALNRPGGSPLVLSHVDTLKSALAHLECKPVDVVLLDLSLPDSQGMTTLEQLQRAHTGLPIVVLTGHDEPGVAENALERGAQDFIAKRDLPDFPVARAISWAVSRMHAQIERAMLIERLAREQERLMYELHSARQMQMALLPRPDRLEKSLAPLGLALDSRFEPSFAIGGDLWGSFDLGQGRIAFYTFDFSGHGISAALNVFRLHTLLDSHAELRGDPALLLAGLNESLAGLLGAGQFATMFYAVLDTGVGEMLWSAAGAPRPLLVGNNGSRLDFLDTTGIPLGIGPGVAYSNRTVAFPPGAGMLLYSDAMSEAADEYGDFVGEEGVEALVAETLDADGRLTLDSLFDRFFQRVRSPLTDDLTILWIARK